MLPWPAGGADRSPSPGAPPPQAKHEKVSSSRAAARGMAAHYPTHWDPRCEPALLEVVLAVPGPEQALHGRPHHLVGVLQVHPLEGRRDHRGGPYPDQPVAGVEPLVVRPAAALPPLRISANSWERILANEPIPINVCSHLSTSSYYHPAHN